MTATDVIHTGDSMDVLDDLDENSVHMCMTSPPYWNLRDYDHADQLGREETPEAYVDKLADVFDKVFRVLRPDGSLWLNLGDTYDDKDLQQIPARVALELQSRGWILRNRVTWKKPGGGMPSSATDRLSNETEAVFHFVQSRSYYYDLDAIREPHAESTRERMGEGYGNAGDNKYKTDDSAGSHHRGGFHDPDMNFDELLNEDGKNPGDVFEVTIKPFPDAHFAVYPPELCEKPIKATCPDDGVVLDPFAGAGTTLLKAKELGRHFIGVELNPEYADMARARCGLTVNNPAHVRPGTDDGQTGMEAFTDD